MAEDPVVEDAKPDEDTKPDETPDDLGDAGKKALERERTARKELERKVKELEPFATKAKELEDANKTETQKLIEERDSHKTTAEKTAADLMRLNVALAKAPDGMPAAKVAQLAKRLHGATQEELEADADELFADFVPDGKQTVTPGGGKPKERLRGGGDPEDTPQETDPHKLAALIPRHTF